MAIDPIVITALALTMLGAMVRGLTLHAWPPPLALTSPPSSHSFTQGTSLGALLVVLHPHMSFRRLGELQGLAAGLMLSISVFDLYQESEEAVGRFWATTCFYAGVVFFAVIVVFIPDPDSASIIIPDEEEEEKEKVGPTRKEIIPSSTPEKVRPHPNITTRSALKQRKAIEALEEEVPPATPFNQLNEKKKGNKGKPSSAKASSEREKTREAKKRVLMSGLITAVGIALHNFPEGVAVFLASFKSAKIGASIAFGA